MKFNFKIQFADTVHYHSYLNVLNEYSDILLILISNILITHIVHFKNNIFYRACIAQVPSYNKIHFILYDYY